MTTTKIQWVPRLIAITERVRTFESGRVVVRDLEIAQEVQDEFGPLDWVRYLRRTPLPKPVAKTERASELNVYGFCVLAFAILCVFTWFPKDNPLREIGFLVGPLSFLGAALLFVMAAEKKSPNASDAILAGFYGVSAVANLQQGRKGWAAADGVFLLASAARIHERVKAGRDAAQADLEYWESLEDAPLAERWEAANWYYDALCEEWSDLTGTPVERVPLKNYEQAAAYLRANPQRW